MATSRSALKSIAICFALAAITWIVFGQTLRHEFVNFDDGAYVYRNFDVTRGLTFDGAKWAFTHVVAANWHPLTILSHMLDCRLYGVNPAGHHFTNVLLHTLAVVLLFLVLNWITKALWRSAFVAAVFAVHPLHVESVAWIAERKDVLSAVFFMLTLAAYVYYMRTRTIGRYLLMSILFGCGLMAKPMLVTLPFVLLLLDYWPLNSGQKISKLIIEKIPLFALSAAASVATLITQDQSINLVQKLSLTGRIWNALAATVIYLRQTVWPTNLAVFYPYSEDVSIGQVTLAIVLVGAITAGVILLRRKMPYLLTGWFWYLGMLVPVIGIVQVGMQAHADRYTYLPQIGIALAATWTIADFLERWRYREVILGALSLTIVALLMFVARLQVSYWRDSQSLWEHTVAITPDNELADEHLADAYLDKNRIDDAIAQAQKAVRAQPNSAEAHGTLGASLARKGKPDEAALELRKALQLNPKLRRANYNLGNCMLQEGRVDEAVARYEQELRIQPNFPEGQNNLANALFRQNRPEAAFEHLQTALALKPDYAEARNNLAIALSQRGDMRNALEQWRTSLQLQPDNLEAHCNLAWVFATSADASIRDGAQSVQHAERALQLSDRKNARIWRLAAAAYAEAGRFDDAVKAAQNGLALAENENNADLVRTLQENLELFQARQPLRDVSSTATPR
jgi:protein O-mannosyl-transferase